MPKKSTREDGRGHWPKGKRRNRPPKDWPSVKRALERLLRNPERGDVATELVRSRRGLAAVLGVSDRQVRRWMSEEDMPSVERVAAIRRWMEHWAN